MYGLITGGLLQIQTKDLRQQHIALYHQGLSASLSSYQIRIWDSLIIQPQKDQNPSSKQY